MTIRTQSRISIAAALAATLGAGLTERHVEARIPEPDQFFFRPLPSRWGRKPSGAAAAKRASRKRRNIAMRRGR